MDHQIQTIHNMMVFCAVFYVLYNMPSYKRNHAIHPLMSMTDLFKGNRWYWEFTLIARRI